MNAYLILWPDSTHTVIVADDLHHLGQLAADYADLTAAFIKRLEPGDSFDEDSGPRFESDEATCLQEWFRVDRSPHLFYRKVKLQDPEVFILKRLIEESEQRNRPTSVENQGPVATIPNPIVALQEEVDALRKKVEDLNNRTPHWRVNVLTGKTVMLPPQ